MIEIFNNHFEDLCNNLKNQRKKFILGLSGGIDSMALLYLLKNFIKSNKNLGIEVLPIIIDHGLRSNSANEAKDVKYIATHLGFKTIIRKINIKKPSGNIQNWARKERRRILCDIAFDSSANILLGHHSDDQVETIFMRSIKSSGIDGLVGIQDKKIWNGILIFRPLILFNKNQITSYVNKNNIKYFQDSSNFMCKFERVRVRGMLKNISLSNWPTISEDLIKFSFLNKILLKKINHIYFKWIKSNVLIDNRGALRIDFEKFKYIYESSSLFSINILGKIIKTIGGKEFSPKRKKTLNCLKFIFSFSFKNTNLGNVNISLKNNYLFFIRENRNINFKIKIIKNKKYIFDGRFLLTSKYSGNLINPNIKEFDRECLDEAFVEYKDEINNTIPFMSTLEGVTVRPHFNNVDVKSDNKSHGKQNGFDLRLINRLLI
ncbi:tRNA lysidine(34) synthetase TilS [Alphaproteobacteria bacterium]|nr:tRNA lysidine(34) synthetase TilS [Alphaproteobacteria bacterium]